MRSQRVIWATVFVWLAAVLARSEDWNQWRGARRAGVAPGEPRLLERWPEDGPTKLWESEKFPGSNGYSCPSVYKGRVYMLVGWKRKEPLITRTFGKLEMRGLGCFEKKPDAPLLEKVEAARASEEREKLNRRELNNWIKKWMSENLSDTETKQHSSFVKDRLKRGARALPMEALAKLLTLKDREFPNTAELEKWLEEHAITGETKASVLKVFKSEVVKANDTILCLNDADGTTLWKFEREGAPENRKTCSTPCVVDGRRFVIGSTGMMYCVDAVEGKEIWTSDVAASGGGANSSPVVVGDKVIVLAGALTAFDIETGEVKWRQEKVDGRDNSPSAWSHGDAPYVVCNTKGGLRCVKAENGEVVWTVKGGSKSSAAVSDSHAVICSGKKDAGFVCYEISPTGAKELWKAPLFDSYVSPVIHGERVYATGDKRAMCVELATGKTLWDVDIGADKCSSPAVADGTLINVNGAGAIMARFTPETCELRGTLKCKVLRYTSPSLCNGKLYLRMQRSIACYRVGTEDAPAEERLAPP